MIIGYIDGKLKRKSVYGATRKKVKDRLTKLLNDQQRGLPIELVDRPNVAKHEIMPLTVAQARALLTTAKNHRLGALFSVALALGLRKGEALGLRWQDVDFEAGTITISGARQRIDGKLVRTETKNNSSRRMLHVPNAALRALRDHWMRQRRERLLAGEKWQDTGLVFTTQLGTPLDPSNMARQFSRVLEAAGIAHIRFHDLRHSCATLLLAQGLPARVVQDILGHSAIRVTMDVYSHVMPSMRDEAARAMDSVLGA